MNIIIGGSSNGRTTDSGSVYWSSNLYPPASKMLTKIWKAIIFLVILTISLSLSGFITYIIGDKLFGAFQPGCPQDTTCLQFVEKRSIWSYPYNLLFWIFVTLATAITISLTMLILKYFSKEGKTSAISRNIEKT